MTLGIWNDSYSDSKLLKWEYCAYLISCDKTLVEHSSLIYFELYPHVVIHAFISCDGQLCASSPPLH